MADPRERTTSTQATDRESIGPDTLDGAGFRRMLAAASAWLDQHADAIDAINVFPVPDGDTGRNMAQTLRAAWQAVGAEPSDALGDVTRAAADGALLGARGNSGVILSQWLRGLAQGVEDRREAGTGLLADALARASTRAYAAIEEPREGTILSVARAAALCGPNPEAFTPQEALRGAVARAEDAVARTPAADAAAGRGGRRRLRRAGAGRRAGRVRARPARRGPPAAVGRLRPGPQRLAAGRVAPDGEPRRLRLLHGVRAQRRRARPGAAARGARLPGRLAGRRRRRPFGAHPRPHRHARGRLRRWPPLRRRRPVHDGRHGRAARRARPSRRRDGRRRRDRLRGGGRRRIRRRLRAVVPGTGRGDRARGRDAESQRRRDPVGRACDRGRQRPGPAQRPQRDRRRASGRRTRRRGGGRRCTSSPRRASPPP